MDDRDERKAKDRKKATGKAKGGVARAAALAPERRREIAIKAAAGRWGEKPLRATHRGSFKEDFGFDVECYVLDDERKTAVISQRGMGVAIGLTEGGSRLPTFVGSQGLADFGGRELAEKMSKPLIFKWLPVGANPPPPVLVHGYDVTFLIDLCNAVIAANDAGALQKRHANMVTQSHIILRASAKAGIKGLVYALAGYDATKQEVIEAFKFYVREEAREYEKEFPDQLYGEWYRLYQLPKPERNKPWKFRTLTIDHVYTPLAKSNGEILQLARDQRSKGEERRKKLHQFLSEVGVKALRTHLGQLLGIAQVSSGAEEYERHVEKIFGTQLRWDF